MTFVDAKQRFSNRVADYIRYRPGYPSAIHEVLRAECGLRPGHVIADIGSGTGFLSELFLKKGNRVFGVEPNEAMRQAGEEYLASFDGFTSVNGSAEATTLDDASVDFVTAGQAFHWFDQNAARREFIAHPEARRLGRRRLERAAHGHKSLCPRVRRLASKVRHGLRQREGKLSERTAHARFFWLKSVLLSRAAEFSGI